MDGSGWRLDGPRAARGRRVGQDAHTKSRPGGSPTAPTGAARDTTPDGLPGV